MDKEKVKVENMKVNESIDFLDSKAKVRKKGIVTPKTEIAKEVQGGPPKELSDNISQLWVDKYKPTSMKRIIGQTTERSNAPKLFNWLKNWQKFYGANSNGVKKSWNDQDTGSTFKCALLSGPPGIGKTTTATLVANEAGYTYIEFNASDSRSKKLLDKVLGNVNTFLKHLEKAWLSMRSNIKVFSKMKFSD